MRSVRACHAACAIGLALAAMTGAAPAQDGDPAGPSQGQGQDAAPVLPPAPEVAPPLPRTLPTQVDEAIGTWDLSLDGGARRCTLVLSAESGRNGRALRFPAGCRRALPVLNRVAGWLYLESGIRFVDEQVRPVLAFVARPDAQSMVATEAASTYNLVPLQTMGQLLTDPKPALAAPGDGPAAVPPAAEGPAEAIPDIAGERRIPGAEPVLSAGALQPPMEGASPARTPSDAPARGEGPGPGIYALDRFSQKDVCRIAFADPADSTGPGKPRREAAPPAQTWSAAQLVPDCRDGGITVFDPVAWRFANGHLSIKARRGHVINLVETGPGTWRRDPDTGTTLILRRVE